MKEFAWKVSLLLFCHNKFITSRNMAGLVTREWPAIAKAVTKHQGMDFVGDMPWAQSTGVRAQQGSKSHPWFLLPGLSGAGISDCLPRSSWKMSKTGIHHPAWDESLSSDRLIWSLVFWTVCVFHREKNNFRMKDLFFCQIFPKFQLFFF